MIEQVLGHDLVVRPAARLTRRRLRVLAYHGVPDPDAFARQVEYLTTEWHPVSAEAVVERFRSGTELPDRAVWLTFDDGLWSTVVEGRQVLDRFGVKGTVFVNPGAIGTHQWWDALEAAEGADAVAAAKLVADDERRELVRRAEAALSEVDLARLAGRVASAAELRAWVDAGHTVGNHTWDHPCLDRCRPEVQIHQVEAGASALAGAGLTDLDLFAYPNGNRSSLVEDHLRTTGCDLALLFDHRVDALDEPLAVSRLRVDSAAPLARLKSILSGVHSALLHLRDRTSRATR